MHVIRVFIESGQLYRRRDVLEVLAAEEDIQLVGEPRGWPQVRHSLEVLRPDVLLIDLDTPAGIPAGLDRLDDLHRSNPAIKTLILCDACSTELVVAGLKQNVKGCLPKNAPPEAYVKAIRSVYGGDLWVGRQLMVDLVDALLKTNSHHELMERLHGCVTEREREIIEYVTQGMTNKEIAKVLGISDKTVKTHLSNVFQKLKVGRRQKLSRFEA